MQCTDSMNARGGNCTKMNLELKDPQKDFDFFIGRWQVHHKKLKERLKRSTSWDIFAGTVVTRAVWGGKANMDQFEGINGAGEGQGMTLRLYDPKSQQWSLYWANSINGTLEKPTIGGFKEGRGEFYNQDSFEGKSIFVRFIWSNITPTSCHWEQAFSEDGGKSWETNWIMDFTRVE